MEFVPLVLGPVLVSVALCFQLLLYRRVREERKASAANYRDVADLHGRVAELFRKIDLYDRAHKGLTSNLTMYAMTTDGDILMLKEDKPPYIADGVIKIDTSHKFDETMEIDILQLYIADEAGVITSSVPRGMTKGKWYSGTSMHIFISIDISDPLVEVK